MVQLVVVQVLDELHDGLDERGDALRGHRQVLFRCRAAGRRGQCSRCVQAAASAAFGWSGGERLGKYAPPFLP
jgi:hypothetical protein